MRFELMTHGLKGRYSDLLSYIPIWWERLIENHHDVIYHSTVLYTYLYCSFSNSLVLCTGLEPITFTL